MDAPGRAPLCARDRRRRDLALLKTGQADFTIAQKGVADLLSSSIDARSLARIRAVPGVAGVTGVLIGTERLNAANPQFLQIGIDPADLAAFGVTVVAGRPFAASAADELMLGWRAAENLGLHAGDTLRVADRTYRIAGIYSTGQALGDTGAMLPLAWFQTRRRVAAMIMSEALLIGLIGTAAGLALSVLAVLAVQQLPALFQLHNLLPQLSAVQNVEVAMFGTGLSLRRRRDRARSLLADVDLAGLEARPPTKLSGGERQRVAIARALANEPELLLADEPTGSLDERSVDLVLDLFARLRAERPGMTMIIVTHDVRVAGTADRVIWLRDGRVDYAHRAAGSV